MDPANPSIVRIRAEADQLRALSREVVLKLSQSERDELILGCLARRFDQFDEPVQQLIGNIVAVAVLDLCEPDPTV